MAMYRTEDLTVEEKLRLLCSNGFWFTSDLDGKLPTVCVSDGPLGVRAERKNESGEVYTVPSVSYPSSQSLANSWSDECARLMGECLSDDCREKNVDILLGPGVNIKRHPLCGRNFEYFSEDPYLAGILAKNYIDGLQSCGIGACLKHFCCNNLEYNRFEQSSEVDERTLREIYYRPFEIACEVKPVSVMCSYNRINGRYASEYAKGFKVLRDEFGFDGVIYSDWESVRNRTAAAKAGLDIEFPFNENNYKKFVEDYKNGLITEAEIDACAERVLDMVYRCKKMQAGKAVKRSVEKRLEAAEKIAAESIVLLKNADGILPLKKGSRVCAVGCYAKPERGMIAGGGSSQVVSLSEKFDIIELLEKSLGAEIPYDGMFYYDKVLGTNGYGDFVGKPHIARNNAATLDISLIFVGTGSPFEYESYDRADMRLPYVQERAILDLTAVNPNTVVIIFAGAPIDMSAWADKVKGIVYAGFCGERGPDAISDILCGKVNPSGKLSETFPVSFADTPVANGYIDAAVTRYTEGLDVGYRYYDRHPEKIMYPFGYGLSYSSFEYSGLNVTAEGLDAAVKFDIKNASKIDGKEVAQVYVQEVSPVVYRPIKELKAFVKTEVKAGEKKTVSVKLNARSFSYYSTADDKWRINDGVYRILVGASSRDIKLSIAVKIAGDAIVEIFSIGGDGNA